MMSQKLYLYKLYKYIKVNSLLHVKIKSLGKEISEIYNFLVNWLIGL